MLFLELESRASLEVVNISLFVVGGGREVKFYGVNLPLQTTLLISWNHNSFAHFAAKFDSNNLIISVLACMLPAHIYTSGSGTTSLAWTCIKVCGYSDSFCKNLNQRSLTPRWPLTPHLLRSYVWLYPRIIVSKSHENTSKYVDTVTFFAKTWTKGHWPLGDLWPHICWGHMCDSTQGSLCPSPMKIH